MYNPSRTRRCLVFGLTSLFLVGILKSVISVRTHDRSSPPAASQPITITARAQSYLDTVSLKGFFTSSCQTRCPPDPYLMPGMLFSASDGDISKTRWIPFPSTSMPDEGPSLRAKDIPRYQHVTVRELDRAGPDYTAQLASGIGGQGYKDWEWASDRTVLCISDSHDRNSIIQLCSLISLTPYVLWQNHTGGYCHVERLNLTIMNYFLFGLTDDESWGFPDTAEGDEKPSAFESRIPGRLMATAKEEGVYRHPDLVIISCLFWDQWFLQTIADERVEDRQPRRHRGLTRGFTWNEMLWHQSRMRELVVFLRQSFGQDVPLMYRTRQIRNKGYNDRLLKIFQLDQTNLAAAKEMGVKEFRWANLLEGHNRYYDDDHHFPLGPNTYLWGDMVLFYLKRAVTGCWNCHGQG